MSALILVLASGNIAVAPYLVGIILGFGVGIFGHLAKAPAIILLGIALLLLTTALFIIATDPGQG